MPEALVMVMRLVLVLGASSVLLGVGGTLGTLTGYAGLGVAIGVLGVVAMLAAVIIVGMSMIPPTRKAGPGAPVNAELPRKLEVLREELIGLADATKSRGLLALSEAKLSIGQSIVTASSEAILKIQEPQLLRSDLRARARRELHAQQHAERRRMLTGQCVSVLLLLVAMAMVIDAISSHRTIDIQTASGLGVIVAVYGSFVFAVVIFDAACRVARGHREMELAMILIIETIVEIQADGDGNRVRESLDRLLRASVRPPQSSDVPKSKAA